MADRPEQIDDPVLIAAARHALHDEELVAAFAVDGDTAEDAGRARALIDRCATCRDLYTDLVSIGTTIRAAGTSDVIGRTRPAPRDFRITPLDAARLTPGNAFQRAAARLAAGAAMFGRPIGSSLATLGLVGLLVGTMGVAQISSGAAPQSESLGTAGAGSSSAESAAAPAPASTFDVFGAQPAASQTSDRAGAAPIATDARQNEPGAAIAPDGSLLRDVLPWVFAASILLLLVGLGLAVLGFRHARAWRAARERR